MVPEPEELVFHVLKVYDVVRVADSDPAEQVPPLASRVTVYEPAEVEAFVGFVVLRVRAVPWVLYWVLGAPLPPLAL